VVKKSNTVPKKKRCKDSTKKLHRQQREQNEPGRNFVLALSTNANYQFDLSNCNI